MSILTDWMLKFSINCSDERFREAVSHPSLRADNSDVKDYEQLETIGDAVLDLLVLELILSKFPDATPSQLTKGRSNVVNNKVLGELGREIKLDEILMTSPQYEIVDKDLSNSIEAILGAIYIENGMDACNQFLKQIIDPLLMIVNKISGGIDINSEISNPVGQLQEMMQQRKLALPVYEVINQSGPDNDPIFRLKVSIDIEGAEYTAEGKGSTKKRGKERAASELLTRLKSL